MLSQNEQIYMFLFFLFIKWLQMYKKHVNLPIWLNFHTFHIIPDNFLDRNIWGMFWSRVNLFEFEVWTKKPFSKWQDKGFMKIHYQKRFKSYIFRMLQRLMKEFKTIFFCINCFSNTSQSPILLLKKKALLFQTSRKIFVSISISINLPSKWNAIFSFPEITSLIFLLRSVSDSLCTTALRR